MTVGAAFVCSDGLVVCADTEVTIGEIAKTSMAKISTFEHPHKYTVIFVGSGDADFVLMLMQKLKRAMPLTQNPGVEELENAIETTNTEFFHKVLMPYPEQERPVAKVLLAVWMNNGLQVIIKLNGLSITQHLTFECVGIGSVQRNLLLKLYKTRFTVLQIASFAVYFMDQVKQSIVGCGGRTDMVSVNLDGRVTEFDEQKIQELEIKCRRIEKFSLDEMVEKIVSNALEFWG